MASTNTIAGKDGTVTFNSLSIPITQWEATIESDVKNTTDSDDTSGGWESNIPGGFKRWNCSFEAFYQDGTVLPVLDTDAAITLLSVTGSQFAGNCIITSINIVNQVHGGDAVKFTAQATGNGALTETNGA
jgi:hypothetical protein